MSKSLRREIRSARTLAIAKLRIRTCRNLFTSEGADGTALLEKAEFRLATEVEQSEVCTGRRAALFTHLGGTEIGVCVRRFLKHSREERVALVIHEALHHAGVSEQPFDPDGLSPAQLTQLVEDRCLL